MTNGTIIPLPSATSTPIVDPTTAAVSQAQATSASTKSYAPWGNTIPVSIGFRAVTGKVIWSSDFRAVGVDSSGKTQYAVDFAISFGYAGAPADQRALTAVSKLWAAQTEIYNAGDPSVAAAFSGYTMRFHPGLVDAQPDVTIAAVEGTQTPGFRNQMYAVLTNFPLWVLGLTDSLPDITAEIIDSPDSGASIHSYTMLDNLATFVTEDSFIYYPTQNVFYGFIKSGLTPLKIGSYDSGTLTELGRVSVGGSYVTLQPDELGIYDPQGNTLLTVDSTTNTAPLHLINMATGAMMATFGVAGNDILSDSETGFTFKRSGDMFECALLGSIWKGYALGGIWDQFGVLDSALNYKDSSNLGGSIGFGGVDNISDIVSYPIIGRADLNPSTIPITSLPTSAGNGSGGTSILGNSSGSGFAKQDAFILVGRGSNVTLVRIEAQNSQEGFVSTVDLKIAETGTFAQFPGARVNALWIDPVDYDLVVFWSPLDQPTTQNMTKLKIGIADAGSQGKRPTTIGTVWSLTLPEYFDANAMRWNIKQGRYGAQFGYLSDSTNQFVEINLADGQIAAITALARNGLNAYNYRLGGVLEYVHSETHVVEHIDLHGIDGARIPLADIISMMMVSAGYTTDQFTVDTAIDDVAWGSYITSSTSLWSTMSGLATIYNFVYFTSGDKIVFRRSTTIAEDPQFTLTTDDLNPSTDGLYAGMSTVFAAPSELPGNASITYLDKDQFYVSNTQTFRRTNFPVRVEVSANDTTYSVPIIMESAEALTRAAFATFQTYDSSETESFTVAPRFMLMEPGDMLSLTSAEFSYDVLVSEIVINGNKSLTVTGSNRNARANDGFRVGSDGTFVAAGSSTFPITTRTPPAVPPPSSYSTGVAIDTNLLVGGDDVGQSYISPYAGVEANRATGWTGATVQFEVGSGGFNTLYRSTRSMPFGNCGDPLPAVDMPFVTDEDTVLTVAPINFMSTDLECDLSNDDLLAGRNAILIGADGRWELVFYGTAVADGRLLKISRLLRGRRGTDSNTNAHVTNDAVLFVFQDGLNLVRPVAQSKANIGEVMTVEARGDGITGPVVDTTVTLVGNSLRPWAPWHVTGTISTSDIILAWDRRDRVYSVLHDLDGDTPLNEASELYDVEILDGPGGAIVRTIADLTAATVTYTAAQQATDGFTAPANTVTLRVYQKSLVLGRGYSHEFTVWTSV